MFYAVFIPKDTDAIEPTGISLRFSQVIKEVELGNDDDQNDFAAKV